MVSAFPVVQLVHYFHRSPCHRSRCHRSRCHRRRRGMGVGGGFSVLEAMVVLLILVSLVLGALPTLQHWSMRWRVQWTVHSLLTAMAFARAEAVHRGASTTLCRGDVAGACSDAPQTCDGRRAARDDWRCGWLVVVGHRRNGKDARGAPAPVLRRFRSDARVSVISSRNVQALTFRPPTGLASGSAGSIEVADGDTAQGRHRPQRVRHCIRIGMNARARVETVGCA
jgi:type IV fimbrial biogenesis protein FimT